MGPFRRKLHQKPVRCEITVAGGGVPTPGNPNFHGSRGARHIHVPRAVNRHPVPRVGVADIGGPCMRAGGGKLDQVGIEPRGGRVPATGGPYRVGAARHIHIPRAVNRHIRGRVLPRTANIGGPHMVSGSGVLCEESVGPGPAPVEDGVPAAGNPAGGAGCSHCVNTAVRRDRDAPASVIRGVRPQRHIPLKQRVNHQRQRCVKRSAHLKAVSVIVKKDKPAVHRLLCAAHLLVDMGRAVGEGFPTIPHPDFQRAIRAQGQALDVVIAQADDLPVRAGGHMKVVLHPRTASCHFQIHAGIKAFIPHRIERGHPFAVAVRRPDGVVEGAFRQAAPRGFHGNRTVEDQREGMHFHRLRGVLHRWFRIRGGEGSGRFSEELEFWPPLGEAHVGACAVKGEKDFRRVPLALVLNEHRRPRHVLRHGRLCLGGGGCYGGVRRCGFPRQRPAQG